MFNSLFLNVCIMMALISTAYHLVKDYDVLFKKHPYGTKIMIGLVGGMIGVMLMANSIKIDQGIIVDFRNFPVLLGAIFGGPIGAIVSAAIIAFARVSFWGASTASISAVISVSIIAVGSSIFSKMFSDFRKKWIACAVLNLAVPSMFLLYLMKGNENLYQVLGYYILGSLLMTGFIFWLVEYYLDFYYNYVKLTSESTKDFLTGLNNVRAFDSEFNKAINRCARNGECLSFLMLDIDFFKKINDTYGHTAGDVVLKRLSELLVDTCRIFDIISRNGGEEFSVILQDCPMSHAHEVAERIRKAVESTEFKINSEQHVRVTISIGISSYPNSSDNPDKLIEYADKALYHAKQSGRNRVVLNENENYVSKANHTTTEQ